MKNETEEDAGRAAAAGKRHHVLDCGIALDHICYLSNRFIHRRERGILRALHTACQDTGILLQEKIAFGNLEQR